MLLVCRENQKTQMILQARRPSMATVIPPDQLDPTAVPGRDEDADVVLNNVPGESLDDGELGLKAPSSRFRQKIMMGRLIPGLTTGL